MKTRHGTGKGQILTCSEELKIGGRFQRALKFDGAGDFGYLELYKLIWLFGAAVVLAQEMYGFLFATVGDEPPGTLGDHEDSNDLEYRY